MKFCFDPNGKMIIVLASLHSKTDMVHVRLGLDTGASHTCIQPELLVRLGQDISRPTNWIKMTFGTETKTLPMFPVDAIRALGNVKENLLVVSHALPDALNLDGLLGIDFPKGLDLTISFRSATLDLT